jgi:hypothetical protein
MSITDLAARPGTAVEPVCSMRSAREPSAAPMASTQRQKHQNHPGSAPHPSFSDQATGTVFYQRWGWCPMSNWLDTFEQRGLIVRDSECRPTVL